RILSQFLHRLASWRGDEPFFVMFAGDVTQLQRIAPAKRNLSAAVQHLAADIEILVDDDHRRAKITRANGRGQAGTSSSDDDDVCFVVPSNRLGGGNLR